MKIYVFDFRDCKRFLMFLSMHKNVFTSLHILTLILDHKIRSKFSIRKPGSIIIQINPY